MAHTEAATRARMAARTVKMATELVDRLSLLSDDDLEPLVAAVLAQMKARNWGGDR